MVRAPSRAEKGSGIGAGILMSALLQKVAAPLQPPTADSEPTLMLIPPPVKFNALGFGLSEARPQSGALIVGLPWKLIEPDKARTHAGAFAV